MRETASVLFLMVALGAVGCGDDDSMLVDSGMTGDSGMRVDGGTVDSGVGTDGGGTDSGAGTDGGGGTDGGTPTGAPIEFMATCPAFTACGGDLTGTWTYDGTCVTTAEAEGALTGACATATFLMGSGYIDGTVTFDATMVSRMVSTTLDVEANIPTACTMGFGCAIVGPVVESMAMLDSVTCVDAASGRTGCDCTIHNVELVTENDAYTTMGSVFENTRSGRRWEYCNDGAGGLTAHEVAAADASPPVEPGVQSFTSM